METDSVLLKRYAEARDGLAFAELVRRYAGMVYGTCLRLTGDSHLAEDAAQECFLALAREAGAAHSSLPAWLHGTAVNRARMGIRGESRRRNHEEARGTMPAGQEANMGPSWAEVGPHVDEALAELPEELREPLILHFLQQKTQAEIASGLGVDPSTVSRRIDKGLDELRGRLKKAGVVLSLGVLSALLTGNAAQAAPAALVAALTALVEDFFTRSSTDSTSREAIEWGQREVKENGNVSIRYMYKATFRHGDKSIMNQVFTFTPKGEYVSSENVKGFPKDAGESRAWPGPSSEDRLRRKRHLSQFSVCPNWLSIFSCS